MTTRRPPGRGPTGRTRPGRRGVGAEVEARPSASELPARSLARRQMTDRLGRPPRVTGRAAILVLVLAVLMVSYASSMKAYLQQRAHIQELKAQIAERESGIAALEREKQRWEDPAYVQRQARERFGYLMPGERSYVVLDSQGNPLDGSSALNDPAEVVAVAPTAWWTTAWGSIELAGNPPPWSPPPADELREPASKIRAG